MRVSLQERSGAFAPSLLLPSYAFPELFLGVMTEGAVVCDESQRGTSSIFALPCPSLRLLSSFEL